ncbi:MAG: 2-dehydropantoate 2-reductase [Lachnospiraceae bacterium]|nr:2-dehydropantoate 2-reductase [Lachnospiraceae bacterium]
MNIYIDFDDCLCETARYFTGLVANLFGKDVPYERIKFFDLQRSFSLSDEKYELMMIKAHEPEALLSFNETPGAVKTVNEWIDKGYRVSVITGRPYGAYEASREWLDAHDLKRAELYCLNKYGRENHVKDSSFSLEIEDYMKLHFDYAVEDSPLAFRFFEHLPKLKVMVYDRPWNEDADLPGSLYSRCYDWDMIRSMVTEE